jgi:putative NADH-flavin reductase
MRVFVTGASGWVGRGVVPQLTAAGHEVVGLARSDGSAAALRAAGAQVLLGTLDDLDTLRQAAESSDGVIHLAFKHDIAFSGDFAGATKADRRAIHVFGEALADSQLVRDCSPTSRRATTSPETVPDQGTSPVRRLRETFRPGILGRFER